MTKKELTNVLKLYYSKDGVKVIRIGKNRPSYEKMYIMWEKHNIPFQAWKDIKEWLKEQEQCEANNEIEDNDILFLGEKVTNVGEVIPIIKSSQQ